jgi:peptidoglycan/LPS O-acetylase OafA/YrhL
MSRFGYFRSPRRRLQKLQMEHARPRRSSRDAAAEKKLGHVAPLLAAAGLGGSAVAALTWLFRPGSELLVGGAAFAVSLGAAVLLRAGEPRTARTGYLRKLLAKDRTCPTF